MGSAAQPAGTGAAASRAPTEASLITNGVTWYLRSSLQLLEGRLEVATPRTILGFLPTGTRRFDEPVGELRSVALGTRLYPERLVVAVGLGLLAIFGNLGTVGSVVVSIAGVAMLLLSFIAVIRVESIEPRPFFVPVCLAHIPRARGFVAAVEYAAPAESATEP